MNRIRTASVALLTVIASGAAFAGPLSPPAGPVTSTMKTIQDVEPRIAINATNTPGDADSVFRISSSGSYYLPASFSGGAGKAIIEIDAQNVTVDLNGFSISGSAIGIRGTGAVSATVRNGVVSNTSSFGVYMYNSVGARIENVSVHHTGSAAAGIQIGRGSVVQSCTATSNKNGIEVGNGSRVVDCVASLNDGSGFTLVSGVYGVTFESCTSEANGANGFNCTLTTGVRIEHCTAMKNVTNGIYAGAESVVTGNTVVENTLYGIVVAADCIVTENQCNRNGALNVNTIGGIFVTGTGNLIERNRCTGNDVGIWITGSTDNVIVGNWCRLNTTANYSIVAGNEFAPVITNPGTTFTGVTAMSNFSY